jgi:uncharacterized protein YcfJ
MNKSIWSGIGIGIVVAAAAGALANYSMKRSSAPAVADSTLSQPALSSDAPLESSSNDAGAGADAGAGTPAKPAVTRATAASATFARVLRSEPIVEKERVARQECSDQQVTRQKPVKDEKRVAGAALGAVLGGVLGHQVGDGNGQTLATVAGAAAGGYAGSKAQQRLQENNTETVTEKVCKTVYDERDRQVGYNVTYSIDGAVHTQRMQRDPGLGSSLPVKNGQLVLNAQTGARDRGTT